MFLLSGVEKLLEIEPTTLDQPLACKLVFLAGINRAACSRSEEGDTVKP